MKLPSPNDSKFFQNLLDEEELEDLMDAEEYLVPHSFNIQPLAYTPRTRIDSSKNQFGCQDPSFSMGDMLATLPRVAPSACGSSHPPQELAVGGQISGGFSRGNQDDPRCNGTLRKQAPPRSNMLGAGSALSAGQVIDGASYHTLHLAGAAAAPKSQSTHVDDEYINEPLYLNTFLNPGDKNGLAGAISISASTSSAAQSVLQTGNPSTSSHIISPSGYVLTPSTIPGPPYPSQTLHPGHSGQTLHSGITSNTMMFDKKGKKATFDNPEYWQHSLPPKSTLHNPEYLQDCSTRFFYRQNGRIRPAVAENQEYLSEAAMKAGNVLPPPPYRQRNTVV
uniref:V-erb-a erythroblastic leukemia viral oncogene homolog 4 (Avian) n=1 Tax=Iconisemion striatum TaxID=60296 RepID=A0A1A7WSM2_9TELE